MLRRASWTAWVRSSKRNIGYKLQTGCKSYTKTEYVYVYDEELKRDVLSMIYDPVLKMYIPETEEVEVVYCSGHVDLTVNVTVLTFDQIFAADTYGNAGQNADIVPLE